MNDAERLRVELLSRAGRMLFGEQWQRPFARLLGTHHPDGPRNSIDDRLVRRWASGGRSIPDWVFVTLSHIATAQAAAFVELGEDLDGVMGGRDDQAEKPG